MIEERCKTILVQDRRAFSVRLNRPETKGTINGHQVDRASSSARKPGRELGDGPQGRRRSLLLRERLHPSLAWAGEVRHGTHPCVTLSLHNHSIPTVDYVDCDAIGAGCNLTLGCDLVLASTRSCFTEIVRHCGLSVDSGGSWILPRLVGLHRTETLCLTGDLVSPCEAMQLGLVSRVLDPERLEADIRARRPPQQPDRQWPRRASCACSTMEACRTIADALNDESEAHAVVLASPAAAEARRNFLGQRPSRLRGSAAPLAVDTGGRR